MTTIKDYINSLNEATDYKNFSEEVTILKENKSGTNYSLYTVKNKNGVTFQKVPGSAGISDAGFMGFINGDRNRPVMLGTGTKVNETKSTINPPWIAMASIANPTIDGISLSEFVNLKLPIKALFAGGHPGNKTTIDYVNFTSSMNSIFFGDLTLGRGNLAAASDISRGLFAGGQNTDEVSGDNEIIIDYVTIASMMNAIVFGDLITKRDQLTGSSDSTRALFAGGEMNNFSPSNVDAIEYVTIQSLGNAVDFGNLSATKHSLASCADSTRALFGGGVTTVRIDVIEYVTIQSLGNAVDFGDLSGIKGELAASADTTRGLWGGGITTGSVELDIVEYSTIQSLANVTDHGDLTLARYGLASSSDLISSLFAGGFENISWVNNIDKTTIQTLGNAIDFGDLGAITAGLASCSG